MGRKIDLSDKKFGKWTVIKRAGILNANSAWHCVCDCESKIEKIVSSKHLLAGSSTHCGCSRRKPTAPRPPSSRLIDLTGQTFADFTVIERAENNRNGQAMWLCKCACGNDETVSSACLRVGDTTRCVKCRKGKGARPFRTQENPNESAINKVLGGYIYTARKKGNKWSLSRELAIALFLGNCFYCNRPPSNLFETPSVHAHNVGRFVYNGIDRKDNSEGYTAENVVSCCTACNFIKGDRSVAEMHAWQDRVAAHRAKQRPPVTCETA